MHYGVEIGENSVPIFTHILMQAKVGLLVAVMVLVLFESCATLNEYHSVRSCMCSQCGSLIHS